MHYPKRINMRTQYTILRAISHQRLSQNGSTKNGTVREAKMLATIKNGLYLCSAFETQMPEIEY